MQHKDHHRGGPRAGAGRPPNSERRIKVTVSLSPEQVAFAQAQADDRSVTLSEAVRDFLDLALKNTRR